MNDPSAELARLTTELADARAALAQERGATEAAHAKLRSIERAIRVWTEVGHHFRWDKGCQECAALFAIAGGTYADPLLAELDAARAVVAAAQAALDSAAPIDDGVHTVPDTQIARLDRAVHEATKARET